jgi:hypothetical protein
MGTCENTYGRYNMNVKVGDIYIRDSDERVYRVKNIDNKMVVLEAENGQLSLTDVFGLERAYRKKEPKPPH